ncbi:hypothetical protein HY837_03710 [archaeon]|nr:hypothetical protein [archaeon]
MKLEELANKGAYAYLERYVNSPKYSVFAQYSEVKQEFHPRVGTAKIFIPYQVRKDIDVLTAYPDEKLLSKINYEGVKFYEHPQFSDNADGFILATPTASTRTVINENDKSYFIKLHFPARISRFNRRLTANSVKHSIRVSKDLEESLAYAPKSFAYLPESIGLIAPEGHGCIIREITPRPLAKDERYLIPFFALYSKDPQTSDEPLLIQMIKKSKETPLDYFINKIVHPFIEVWAFYSRERGILLENHCQNTLLEINQKYEPTRIVCRDFQSDMIDTQVREEKNLEIPFEKHLIGGKQDPFPKEQEYSIVWDHFVASYVFPYFSACLKEHFNITEETTQKAIQQKFREIFTNQEKYFPKTEFKLVNKIFENNEVQLEDTHEPPKYR